MQNGSLGFFSWLRVEGNAHSKEVGKRKIVISRTPLIPTSGPGRNEVVVEEIEIAVAWRLDMESAEVEGELWLYCWIYLNT
jgi:hypothetical protein